MKNKLLIVLSVVVFATAYALYENVLNRPFPFISMKYCAYDEFNAPPSNSNISTTIEFNQTKIRELKLFVSQFKKLKIFNLEDDIKAATLATREFMHISMGTDIRQMSDIISKDKKYLQLCSESSKIFISFMQSMNYSARVIWMNGHTISEVYSKENGWIVVDTYGNIMFKDKKGKYQGILDITKKFNQLNVLEIVDAKYENNPNYLDEGLSNKEFDVYKKQNLFVIIEGKYLMDFHLNTRRVEKVLDFMLFNHPFATGVQYLKEDSKKVGNVGVSFYKRF